MHYSSVVAFHFTVVWKARRWLHIQSTGSRGSWMWRCAHEDIIQTWLFHMIPLLISLLLCLILHCATYLVSFLCLLDRLKKSAYHDHRWRSLTQTKFHGREMKSYLYFSAVSTALLTPVELICSSSSWPGDGHLVRVVILHVSNSVVPWVCEETLGRCRLIVWKIGLMSPNQIDHYVLVKLQNSFIWQGPGHIT